MSRFKKAIERIADCVIPTKFFIVAIEPWNYSLFSLSILSIDFQWTNTILELFGVETDFKEGILISFLFVFNLRISKTDDGWNRDFYVIL